MFFYYIVENENGKRVNDDTYITYLTYVELERYFVYLDFRLKDKLTITTHTNNFAEMHNSNNIGNKKSIIYIEKKKRFACETHVRILFFFYFFLIVFPFYCFSFAFALYLQQIYLVYCIERHKHYRHSIHTQIKCDYEEFLR